MAKTSKSYRNIAISVETAYCSEELFRFDQVKLILVHPLSEADWKNERPGVRVVDQFSLMDESLDHRMVKALYRSHPRLLVLLKQFLSDYDTYHIFERKSVSKSLFNIDEKATELFYKAFHLLSSMHIDLLIVHDTPHSLMDFTLSKCASLLNIKIYNLRRSFLTWRTAVFDGLWYSTKRPQSALSEVSDEDLMAVRDYVSALRSSHLLAMPDSEKKRHLKWKGKFWSWKVELENWSKARFNPKRLVGIRAKFNAHKQLKQLASIPPPGQDYVAVYLHLQPERTTCPEGSIFNTPWIGIQLLRSLIPEDVHIYVREHPATYRYSYNVKVRPKNFYAKFNSLLNVNIADIAQDSYEFLDSSLFCVSVTGTIAFEAVARGKVCVYMGDASYSGCPGTYHIEELIKAPGLLDQILMKEGVPSDDELYTYLEREMTRSYGRPPESESFTDYNLYQNNWIRALIKLISLETSSNNDDKN